MIKYDWKKLGGAIITWLGFYKEYKSTTTGVGHVSVSVTSKWKWKLPPHDILGMYKHDSR